MAHKFQRSPNFLAVSGKYPIPIPDLSVSCDYSLRGHCTHISRYLQSQEMFLAERVHLREVAGNTVWSYMARDAP